MLERNVVAYLRACVKARGGEMRKVCWEGRNGAPDWLLLFPETDKCVGLLAFVEAKAPGKKPRPNQVRELKLLAACGANAFVCDSPNMVDDTLNLIDGKRRRK